MTHTDWGSVCVTSVTHCLCSSSRLGKATKQQNDTEPPAKAEFRLPEAAGQQTRCAFLLRARFQLGNEDRGDRAGASVGSTQ